ncbi:MAG: hypothetical protein DBY30_02415 [Verrucomicrobia bacterium]|nr:MAG: hypothetical protein DBY30_02415 [Verrucomicrobiota bacterium]
MRGESMKGKSKKSTYSTTFGVDPKVYPVIPQKTEYFLTDLGESVVPVIRAMDDWGNAHRSVVE